MTFSLRNALLLVSSCLLALPSYAEQSVEINGYEVHYSVVGSTFLQPKVAEKYDIVRSDNRAIITIAARHDEAKPRPTKITGSVTNLLSQEIALEFRLIEDGEARYYLATFRFTHEEPLTFKIQVHLADGPHEFSFKQQVFQP